MTARAACLALAALAGCGRLLGIEDFSGRDGGPPDGPPGPPLRISGFIQGNFGGGPSGPLAGAQVEFYRLPGGTRAASAISMPGGTYSLDVPTEGPTLYGYVRVEPPPGQELFRTFHYLPGPVSSATVLNLDLLDGPLLSQIASLYGDIQIPNAFAVFMQVVDAIGVPAVGVSVQADPSLLRVRYDDQNGQPSPIASVTGPGGVAYVFNGPAGNRVTVTGLGAGRTFGPVATPPTEPASCYFITLRSAN